MTVGWVKLSTGHSLRLSEHVQSAFSSSLNVAFAGTKEDKRKVFAQEVWFCVGVGAVIFTTREADGSTIAQDRFGIYIL